MIALWMARGVNRAMPSTFGFLEITPENVLLTAFKLEQEDWGPGAPVIARLYETAGQQTEARLTFAAPLMMLEETNHLEECIESSSVRWMEDTATIAFRPHEIKTFRFRLAIPAFAIDKGEPEDVGGFEGG